jgi:hypothetical protein
MLWADMDQITEWLRGNIWVIVGGILGLLVIVILFKVLSGGKKTHKDLQKGQREDLEDYPPPPESKGGRKLLLDGMEVRVRLVVVAPMGKQQDAIDAEDVPELLNDVLRGLGAFVAADKARVRVWPAQLSAAGFAPTFFRLVTSPDEPGTKSNWVLTAGPAKAAGRPILLGMALYSEEESKLGRVTLDGKEWVESLQVSK